MPATTSDSRDFDVQILEETVRGHFAGKNALMGSALVSGGAVRVNSQLPRGRDDLGNEITIPYFGTIGKFENNPEDTAVTPKVLKSTNEKATLARSSLAFEVTRLARHSGPEDADPYVECSNQIEVAGVREMDRLIVDKAAATPMVRDVYVSGSPAYLDWTQMVRGRAMFGDEQDGIVGMVVHSQVEAGLHELRDANGRPLLLDSQTQNGIQKFNNIPLLVSDQVPLTGSSMGTVTEAGASVGGVGLTGTPTGPWDLRIDIVVGGARGTATFRFSTDGGNTWSATLTTAATVALVDTNADSTVGNNGETGLTATFAVATYDALSVYSSRANLCATSLILQRESLVFWYAAAHMGLETDKDILKHNDVAAMHLYYVAHMYRRRRGGRRPGVVAIKHNVPNWIG